MLNDGSWLHRRGGGMSGAFTLRPKVQMSIASAMAKASLTSMARYLTGDALGRGLAGAPDRG